MKNLLVFAALLMVVSCQRQASDRLAPEVSVKKSEEFKFYNQDKKDIPTHEKGVVLFKLKDNSSLSKVAGVSKTERVFTKAMEKAKDNGFYKGLFQDENKALAELRKNPDVEWASLNTVHTTQTTPDDPYWTDGSLYGMQHIGMPAVWQSGNFGNKQVVVGVIDEGIFGHEDLCQNIWTNPFEIPGNGIDDEGNGYVDDMHGWDWFNNDNEVYPGATHGTHVAGTIGAKGGNKKGVIGVASNVTLISCKFLESYGFDDRAVMAIDYLIDMKQRGVNIKVTSNSWGGGGFNPGLLEAIKRARDADILFVAAAGNHAANNDLTPNYPSNYDVDNIIAVGASDWQNNKASFSCFGPTMVDIFAPGVGTISTVPTDQHTSGYAFFSGTSMATPHISGACALYAGINGDATYLQIKNAILNSASKLPQLKGLCLGNEQGGNFLNVSTFTGQTAEHQPPFYDCPSVTPDNIPPTTPQNFKIYEVGFDPRPGAFYGGYIGVRWDRSTDNIGVSGYVLWFNDVPAWFLGGNNFVIAGLDTTEPIIAWVHAQDSWGNVSGFSNKDTAIWNGTPTPPDIQAPTVPQNVTLSNITTSSIKINWNASTDNIGVSAYQINWRAAGGSWLVTTVNQTTGTLNNLSSGITYEINVQAKDAAGNISNQSTTVTGTTLQDSPTCNITSQLEATSQSLNVGLSWTTNITGTCTVSSTRLERKKGSGAYSVVAFNPTSPHQDNVPNPGNYTYRLQIVSSTGQTFYSNERIIKVNKK